MPNFKASAIKTAVVPLILSPSGLSLTAELFLGPDENTRIVTSGEKGFTSTGQKQNVSLPITMPGTAGTYHVYIDIRAEGSVVLAYQATEDVVITAEEEELYSDYPEGGIATPAIGSIAWQDKSEELDHITPSPVFFGTILLPKPTATQFYYVRGLLDGFEEGAVNYSRPTYMGAGIWQLSGAAPIPYVMPHRECYKTLTLWYIKCPACGFVKGTYYTWGKTYQAYLQDWLAGHAASKCHEGNQAHCTLNAYSQPIWSGQEQELYLTNFACYGTRHNLALEIYLMEQVIAEESIYTETVVVKTWTLNTGLHCTIQEGKANLT